MALDVQSGSDDTWFLVQLKPGGLRRATLNLERQGFPVFMPMQGVTRRRGSRHEHALRPLFPGYVFVRIDIGAGNWRAINSTFGVARLVSFGFAVPRPVPAGFMAALRARTDAHGSLVAVDEMRVGDRIRFLAGPFAEAVAEIEEIPESGRVHALLDIMGRTVRARVPSEQVERL